MKTQAHILTRSLEQGGQWALALAAALLLMVGLTHRAAAQTLEDRVKALEEKTDKGGGESSDSGGTLEKVFGGAEVHGFVSASYFFSSTDPENNPGGSEIPYRTFDRMHNEFMFNKFELSISKAPEVSGDEWDAGYTATVIFGQDADMIQSLGLFDDPDSEYVDVSQAFIHMNVPVGDGLQVKLGKVATLMGLEIIEETINPNWSEGNQFLLVENFTQLGALFSYTWSDKVDTQFALFNGWDVVKDNNQGKSVMARIGIKPDDKTTVGIIGFAGPEQVNSTDVRMGAEVLVSRTWTDDLTTHLQLDYGQEQDVAGVDVSWYAGGVWLIYGFHEKAAVALRADYLADTDGARTGLGGENSDIALYSGTITLNITPIESLQLRPEIRADGSSNAADAFGPGDDSQVTLGMGAAYIF